MVYVEIATIPTVDVNDIERMMSKRKAEINKTRKTNYVRRENTFPINEKGRYQNSNSEMLQY